MMTMKKTQTIKSLSDLAQEILKGGVTVITGAGVSTASGLPDFRGREGLWTGKTHLMDLLTAEGAQEHPEEFRAFCKKAIEVVSEHRPNPVHEMIDQLMEQGLIDTLITQNVDGYHLETSRVAKWDKEDPKRLERIVEMHGNLQRIVCEACRKAGTIEAMEKGEACECGGMLRPDIVLFDEYLTEDAMERGIAALKKTRLLIIIGSTLPVDPVASAPFLVKKNGGQVVVINGEKTPWGELADLNVQEDITTAFTWLYKHLRFAARRHGVRIAPEAFLGAD